MVSTDCKFCADSKNINFICVLTSAPFDIHGENGKWLKTAFEIKTHIVDELEKVSFLGETRNGNAFHFLAINGNKTQKVILIDFQYG